LAVTGLLAFILPAFSAAQGGFTPGSRDIFTLDFAAEPVSEFPKHIKLLKGNLEVVLKDGVRMLRASSEAEFLVPLPEALPQDFTLELDLIPKAGGNPADLMIEGTPARDRGDTSMEVVWSPTLLQAVGGGEMFQMPMRDDLTRSLASQFTRVAARFQGETFTLYTNGQRLYTLTDRKFLRSRVLRVFLGGQDDKDYAVHLARLRIAAIGGTATDRSRKRHPLPLRLRPPRARPVRRIRP
jgi:hypothetical protein